MHTHTHTQTYTSIHTCKQKHKQKHTHTQTSTRWLPNTHTHTQIHARTADRLVGIHIHIHSAHTDLLHTARRRTDPHKRTHKPHTETAFSTDTVRGLRARERESGISRAKESEQKRM